MSRVTRKRPFRRRFPDWTDISRPAVFWGLCVTGDTQAGLSLTKRPFVRDNLKSPEAQQGIQVLLQSRLIV
jgi:hypothetical protein